MLDDHLSELLHRGSLGGLVEGCGRLPPGFSSQIIMRSLLHLALNNTLQVSPAPRVHLKQGRSQVKASRQQSSGGGGGADLAAGVGGVALPQVQSVFVTQAAAGRAVDHAFLVFVTLQTEVMM